jgi:hypothetical protein
VWRAWVEVDIGGYPTTGGAETDFRARLKLAPCRDTGCGFFEEEYLADLCISPTQMNPIEGVDKCKEYDRNDPEDPLRDLKSFKYLEVTTNPLPVGTKYLLIAWRVREHHTDSSYGNGRIKRIGLQRIE